MLEDNVGSSVGEKDKGWGRGLDREPIKVDKRGKENPIKEGFNQKLFGNNIGFSVSKKGRGRRGSR